MITIVCTTNRPDSNTRKVAQMYHDALSGMGEESQVLDLKEVDASWIQGSNYGENVPEFELLVDKFIRNTEKFVFVTPEYNGSFPGYLKFFMDACDYGDWADKKVALMGLASGRAGNVRGLDHLTGILHYLGSEVYSKKVYLSQVNHSLTDNGEIQNEVLSREIELQLNGFVTF
jgi:NAD(P)H-dependent FMN reductase